MKAFLLVLVFGVSLNVFQSKANAAFKFRPLLNPSLFADSVDVEKSSHKPCCHPETMEGSLQYYFPSTAGPNFAGETFYLDYPNRRYAVRVEESTSRSIMLCDSKRTCIFYQMIENLKLCEKFTRTNVSIDDTWVRCIPNNATSQGAVRIGTDKKQSSLLLHNWIFMHQRDKFQRLVTDVDCIPVADFVTYDQGLNSSYKVPVFYIDIAKRIKDPSVFTPPSYCDKANEKQEDSKFQQRMFNSLFATPK